MGQICAFRKQETLISDPYFKRGLKLGFDVVTATYALHFQNERGFIWNFVLENVDNDEDEWDTWSIYTNEKFAFYNYLPGTSTVFLCHLQVDANSYPWNGYLLFPLHG